jgi:hypothetical protein
VPYECDTEGEVAGVTVGAASHAPQPSVARQAGPSQNYVSNRPSLPHRLAAGLFLWLERRVILSPYRALGQWLLAGRSLPAALKETGYHLAADMEGFRMSFRADFIKKKPFNEAMILYALGEDKDASYTAWNAGYVVVGTPRKLVRHHEFPGKRHDGFRRGFVEVFNQAYIVCQQCPKGSPPRRWIQPYFGLLRAQIRLRSRGDIYQKERLQGHLAAMALIDTLTKTDSGAVHSAYQSGIKQFF